MEITSPAGTIIYAGNGEEAAEFEINIWGNGAYTITVEAQRAEGNIHIRVGLLQRAAGGRKERLILKFPKIENNAARQNNGRRFPICGTVCSAIALAKP